MQLRFSLSQREWHGQWHGLMHARYGHDGLLLAFDSGLHVEIVEQHDRIMASEFAEAIALQGLVKVQGGARRPKERAQQIKHKHQTKQKLTEPTYTNTAKLPKDPHTCLLNANGPGLSKADMTSKSLARRSRQVTFKAALLPVCCMRLSN